MVERPFRITHAAMDLGTSMSGESLVIGKYRRLMGKMKMWCKFGPNSRMEVF